MNLPGPCARPSLSLSPLDLAKTLLLLRQRRLQLLMRIMPLEPPGAQLLRRRDKKGLAEVFRAQLTRERQSRRGEEHLLSDGCGIGDVGDGAEVGCRVEAAEEDVQGCIWLEVRCEEVEVVGEGGGRGGGEEGYWC